MNTQQSQFEASRQAGQTSQAGEQGGQWGSQRGGQQMSHGGQQGGQMGVRLQDAETPQQREALHSILKAVKTCEWCADQCVQHADPNMVECIRLCEDVSELGETVIALLPRQSRYAQSVLGTFQQAVQACAQECGHHSHNHCQECAEVLGRTLEATQQLTGGGQQFASQRTGQQSGGW